MIYFFGKPTAEIYAVQKRDKLDTPDQNKLIWLFGNSPLIGNQKIDESLLNVNLRASDGFILANGNKFQYEFSKAIIKGGVLNQECRSILQAFFKTKREKPN